MPWRGGAGFFTLGFLGFFGAAVMAEEREVLGHHPSRKLVRKWARFIFSHLYPPRYAEL